MSFWKTITDPRTKKNLISMVENDESLLAKQRDEINRFKQEREQTFNFGQYIKKLITAMYFPGDYRVRTFDTDDGEVIVFIPRPADGVTFKVTVERIQDSEV